MSAADRPDVPLSGTDLDDLRAILAVRPTPADEILHAVPSSYDTTFTWDYSSSRPALRRLYEKAKTSQWNAASDLAWDTEVDVEQVVSSDFAAIASGIDPGRYEGTVLDRWGALEWLEFGVQNRKWMLSQFLHGEQGALVCTARIVETVPWIDAKLYASTQVVDEARHVEVFARYLDDKLGGGYPVNPHLSALLDDIVGDSRWDMTYLGMQVMVEGLALAAFGYLHQLTQEPLLRSLLRYVMTDEARHVAFGVLSLQEVYAQMSDAELLERQQFAYEAALRMRDRFLSQEVWQHMGVAPADIAPLLLRDPYRAMFQQMLFAKIVPNCKKLGLLDRNAGWLRHRFESMGVIQFEDWTDAGDDDFLRFELGHDASAT